MIESKEMYKEITKRIGNIFHYYRSKKGLSLRELYRRLSISIAVMSDMETGKKLPRIETLIVLCNYLDIPLEKIFSNKLVADSWKELPLLPVKCRKKRRKNQYLKLPFGYKLRIINPFKIEKEVLYESSIADEFPEEIEY